MGQAGAGDVLHCRGVGMGAGKTLPALPRYAQQTPHSSRAFRCSLLGPIL